MERYSGGGASAEPGGRLILGDNREVAGALLSELAGKVDLIYIDPPYGTGRYRAPLQEPGRGGTVRSGRGFSDESALRPEYVDSLYELFVAGRELLSERGQIFVHVDYRASALARLLLDEVLGPQALRNEIVWHYASGSRPTRFYARKSDTILWYAPGKEYVFHPERIGKPRNRCWKCDTVLDRWNHMKACCDEDGRTYRTIRSGGRVYKYYDDEPIPPSSVWLDIPHIQQKDPQRTGYPTQKPIALLERIIWAHSEPGDLVADLCCGSGTTLVAAQKHGRRWLGCDASRLAVHLSRQRLLEGGEGMGEAKGEAKGAGPFTVERVCGDTGEPEEGEGELLLPEPRVVVVDEELGSDSPVRVVLEGEDGLRELDFWAVEPVTPSPSSPPLSSPPPSSPSPSSPSARASSSSEQVFAPRWWAVRTNGTVADESPAWERGGPGGSFRARVRMVTASGAQKTVTVGF
jgi:site-specific DNA-methyltransferase (adenine-specific)/adenine-specific DNA-methyltransferase